EELGDAAKLAKACPGTNLILDHCGNPEALSREKASRWEQAIGLFAGLHSNVVCKVSGIVASTAGKKWTPEDLAPVVNRVLNEFGPDRVMFGGDWPVCLLGATYRQWVEALKAIVRDRRASEQRQ